MWRTWKPGDREWIASRLEVEPKQVSLLLDGWIILKDDPYPVSWSLIRYGYSSEDGWQFIHYGSYSTRLDARRAMDPGYRDALRNAEFKLYMLGVSEEDIGDLLVDEFGIS